MGKAGKAKQKARAAAAAGATEAHDTPETVPATPKARRDGKRKKPKPARTPEEMARSRRELLVGLALATASGSLWFFATADFDVWPLAWVAAAPLLWGIERASTTRRACLFAWWTGITTSAGGFYWIIGLLERFGRLPWIAAAALFLLMCMYQALIFLGFAWSIRNIRAHTRLPMVVLAPLAIVTFELLVPLIFPFYLAITQAWQPLVIQIADVTGPLGVTAIVFAVGGALYDVLVAAPAARRRALLVSGGGAAALVAVTLIYGAIRIAQIDARRDAAPKLKVGLLQPNVGFDEKGNENPHLAPRQLLDMQTRSRELEQAGAELIVWPESSYPYWISRHAKRDWTQADVDLPAAQRDRELPMAPIRSAARREGRAVKLEQMFSTPLFFGSVTHSDGDKYPHNSALLLDRDGSFTGRFDKIFLLIFGEYIPFKDDFEFVEELVPEAAGHMARGKTIDTFPFYARDGREYRLGPMICYEDILPDFGRKLATKHPHLLVNVTNDAWFGDTSEPWEHMALSVFRSVELRTELVRSVNTGVSAFIDANGRVVAHTYAVDPAKDPDKDPHGTTLLHEVAMIEGGHTVYAAIGDLFGWMCASALALLWIGKPLARRIMRRGRAGVA
jgi:apolipoprotein N-acyltransferase